MEAMGKAVIRSFFTSATGRRSWASCLIFVHRALVRSAHAGSRKSNWLHNAQVGLGSVCSVETQATQELGHNILATWTSLFGAVAERYFIKEARGRYEWWLEVRMVPRKYHPAWGISVRCDSLFAPRIAAITADSRGKSCGKVTWSFAPALARLYPRFMALAPAMRTGSKGRLRVRLSQRWAIIFSLAGAFLRHIAAGRSAPPNSDSITTMLSEPAASRRTAGSGARSAGYHEGGWKSKAAA